MALSTRNVGVLVVAALAVAALAGTALWSNRQEDGGPIVSSEPAATPSELAAPAVPPSSVKDEGGPAERGGQRAAPRPEDYPWISAEELKARLDAKERVVILNTRAAPDEPLIAGARFVDENDIETWAAKAPKTTPVVTYCSCVRDAAGVRSALALQRLGFSDVHVLEGGLAAWQAAGYPTSRARR